MAAGQPRRLDGEDSGAPGAPDDARAARAESPLAWNCVPARRFSYPRCTISYPKIRAIRGCHDVYDNPRPALARAGIP